MVCCWDVCCSLPVLHATHCKLTAHRHLAACTCVPHVCPVLLVLQPTPQVFSESDFETFMRNDNEILRSAHARWMLLSERNPTCDTADATSTIEAKGLYIERAPLAIGSAEPTAAAAGNGNGNGNDNASGVPDLAVVGAGVSAEHARMWRDEAGDCWVQDLPSSSGTWVNGKLLKKGDKARLLPQVCLTDTLRESRVGCNTPCVQQHVFNHPWCCCVVLQEGACLDTTS